LLTLYRCNRDDTVDEMDDAGPLDTERAELRANGRAAIELEVEYTRLNSFFSDYTKNISKGGTFIKTPQPLDIGTEFRFRLLVPGLSEPLHLLGRVQWVVTPGDIVAGTDRGVGEPGMGIRFVFRDEAEQQRLEQRVERVMVDSLGQLLYSKLMSQSRAEADADADAADEPATTDSAD
jgi:type IV pilus assembly protein PilZ